MEVNQDQEEHVLPENLENSIKSIADNEHFLRYEIACKNISPKGGSYMGILYLIDIKGKTNEGDKEINIFVKNKVENDELKVYSVSNVFSREKFTYKEIFKLLQELQDEANIPDKERFKLVKSYEETNAKSIILENLAKKGFKVYDRMEPMSLEYAELCIQQLAKFHALSIVIQEKRPNFFNDKLVSLNQPFVFEEDWYGFVSNMSKYSISCLDPEIQKKFGEKILKKVDDYPKYMTDVTGVRTLCHGDYKHNNIMAKEVDGKLLEVISIDFQILHYGCPVLDFLYFIFNGTDQKFRRNHLSNLKNLYYGSMKEFVEHFKMDIVKIFPEAEFERVFKDKLDFGLMINVFYVPFLFAVEDDAPDITNQSLSTLSFKVDNRFTERFRGVVDDFIKWGYL